ncbi:MAG: IS66 family transposase [Gemmatimonadales bacterium]
MAVGWWRAARAWDDRGDRGREQAREIERLRRENERLRRDLERVEEERDRLERERDRLRDELEAARRAAKRQAAPFSKGKPKATPKRPGRKAGGDYGPRRWRPRPGHVDQVVDVFPPAACPHCGDAVVGTGDVRVQYQADIPPVRPHVTEFRSHVGRCPGCRRRVVGRDARQTSTATGAAASQVGPNAIAWAAWLHTGLGVPFAKVATILQTGFGLPMTPGGLVQALHRVAARSTPTYHALVAAVRQAPVVAPDETGWKVAGRLWWLWVFVTREVTVYAIQPGRGYAQATAILGARYGGVLVRDGWAPYRKLSHATHQTCLAHLLRRCHLLLETAQRGAARFPHAVRRLLLAALALRDRRDRGALGGHGLRVAIGRLAARTDRLLAGRITHPPNRRLLRHLRTERPALLTFLSRPDVEATNWQAEQAIRPAVVTRKVCGGNRTPPGATTQQIVASVLRTCTQQQRDPLELLIALQRSPRPTIADLRLPGPAPPA